ncbi:hypothetical protein ABS648_13350 [Pseudomonas solani]|uniref:Uncharacterized protein n=1 Tax=Pseudomonas solani TaxID=2731552 RepID=A0AAU7Y8T0_9PSED
MLFAPALADRAILPTAGGDSYFFNRIGQKQPVAIVSFSSQYQPVEKCMAVSTRNQGAIQTAPIATAKAATESGGSSLMQRVRQTAVVTNGYVHAALGAGAALAFLLGWTIPRRH